MSVIKKYSSTLKKRRRAIKITKLLKYGICTLVVVPMPSINKVEREEPYKRKSIDFSPAIGANLLSKVGSSDKR